MRSAIVVVAKACLSAWPVIAVVPHSPGNQHRLSRAPCAKAKRDPGAIGTGAAVGADDACARIGTGGANLESSLIHSVTRRSRISATLPIRRLFTLTWSETLYPESFGSLHGSCPVTHKPAGMKNRKVWMSFCATPDFQKRRGDRGHHFRGLRRRGLCLLVPPMTMAGTVMLVHSFQNELSLEQAKIVLYQRGLAF